MKKILLVLLLTQLNTFSADRPDRPKGRPAAPSSGPIPSQPIDIPDARQSRLNHAYLSKSERDFSSSFRQGAFFGRPTPTPQQTPSGK